MIIPPNRKQFIPRMAGLFPGKRTRMEARRQGKEESLKLCSDCRTPDTPLWRSGPDGPKTLCNACGIRYSKRRRKELKTEERLSFENEGNSAEEMEELKRRQREKQEEILKALLLRRRRALNYEEMARAARLLLSLSAAVPLQS